MRYMFCSLHFKVAMGVAVWCLMGGTPAQADALGDQLRLCAERSSDSSRLACYDGLVETLRAQQVSPADPMVDVAPATTAPPVTASVPVKVDPSTGAPIKSEDSTAAPVKNTDTFGKAEEQKQSIRVMLEKTKRNSRGDWYFYFDNGEVWKQIDTRNRRIPPLPVAATVSRGIFSSHKLHIDGEVWSMKVRRIK